MIKIPYSLIPAKLLRKISFLFLGLGEIVERFFPGTILSLKQANFEIDSREYISMCLVSSTISSSFFTILVFMLLDKFEVEGLALKVLGIGLLIFLFMFFQQMLYPKLIANKRVKNLEKNLMGAIEEMYVQLNSGVPLFEIMVNISRGEYEEISTEFRKAVKEINAGKPEVEALEELAAANPSQYFRKTIWQIINGLKSGSDLSSIMKEIIDSLVEEQIIQIQKYGSQLSPLAMFYMMVAVILPSLGMTFLIIISSFISLSESSTKLIFWSLYGVVLFFQFMFLGVIKSRRPNLI